MLSVISMLITAFADFIGDLLPLSIILDEDDDVSISIRALILFFFIVVLVYEFIKIFSQRRTK